MKREAGASGAENVARRPSSDERSAAVSGVRAESSSKRTCLRDPSGRASVTTRLLDEVAGHAAPQILGPRPDLLAAEVVAVELRLLFAEAAALHLRRGREIRASRRRCGPRRASGARIRRASARPTPRRRSGRASEARARADARRRRRAAAAARVLTAPAALERPRARRRARPRARCARSGARPAPPRRAPGRSPAREARPRRRGPFPARRAPRREPRGGRADGLEREALSPRRASRGSPVGSAGGRARGKRSSAPASPFGRFRRAARDAASRPSSVEAQTSRYANQPASRRSPSARRSVRRSRARAAASSRQGRMHGRHEPEATGHSRERPPRARVPRGCATSSRRSRSPEMRSKAPDRERLADPTPRLPLDAEAEAVGVEDRAESARRVVAGRRGVEHPQDAALEVARPPCGSRRRGGPGERETAIALTVKSRRARSSSRPPGRTRGSAPGCA